MKKRILSILLATLMVVSLVPAAVFAAEPVGLDNFKKVQTYTDGKFTDVKSDDWFAKNVSSAYELNLMVGKRNDFFDTESNLTVAEAMTIAARLREIYYTGKSEFTQIDGAPWYQVYADYCKKNKIADPADYNMKKAITRGEFAEIFAKALPADALKKINTVQDDMIPDVKKTDKFSAAIYLLYRAGVLVGNDKKGTFAPDTNIKRVEVAAITTRMAQPSLRQSITLAKQSSGGGGSYTPRYTITFDANGHGTAPAEQTIRYGNKITKPADLTATGYTFGGWFKEATCENEWNFATDKVTKNTTLYAKWTANTYSITYKDQGDTDFSGTHGENYPQAHTYGTATALVAPTKTGYTFGGWYTESDCSSDAITSLGATDYTADITLYAKWTQTIYTITLDANGGTGGSATTTVTYGASATASFTAPTKTGHTLDGWYSAKDGGYKVLSADGQTMYGAESYTAPNDPVTWDRVVTTENPVTLYAHWTANTYSITYKDQGDEAFSGTHGDNYPTKHTYGTATALVDPTKVGYNFEGWFTTKECTGDAITELGATAYDAEITLYAKWAEAPVPVTGVSLDKTEITLTVGDEGVNLIATVLPENATNNAVTWTSSDESVATVNQSGNVQAVAAGEATITVTTVDGNKTDTCAVKVTAPAPTFATVADILATVNDFPSDPDNAWKTEDGCKLYIDNGKLKAKNNLSENVDTTTSVTSDGTTWTCGAGDFSDATFTFNITDRVLTSVTVSGSSQGVNGTYYAEFKSLQDIIKDYCFDFPKTADAGWKCTEHSENSMYYENNNDSYYTLTVGKPIPVRIMQDSSYAHKVYGGYEYTLPNYCLIHFNIQGDNLVSVEVKAILDAYNVIAGTYTAPSN